ncbi:hypothetical protein EWM64_g6404 [Hericium alpestre]|uniref:Tf2-1-like SH3-like domain-containing protein n=1 Tax=Hericium alpestre TaxID=135208 RepID=A0A4Y9ZVU5_9AGAM|nr:hypothetical protein EWM64_g6404 [Hericium alpestre]
MKCNNQDHIYDTIHFQVGDKVWLNSKNIKTTQPKAKLADHHLGPFGITDVLGPVSYRLKLLFTWRIHPVFHTSLLLPYKETNAYGPNFPAPPPDLVEGEEEYEVESVLDACLTWNKCGDVWTLRMEAAAKTKTNRVSGGVRGPSISRGECLDV